VSCSTFKASQDWRQARDCTPVKVEVSLRVALLSCLLMEWKARLASCTTTPEQKGGITGLGWAKFTGMTEINPTGQAWTYQRWDPATQTVQEDPARLPLPHNEVEQAVDGLKMLTLTFKDDVVQRCGPTRPLTEKIESTNFPFILATGLRGEPSQDFWSTLRLMEGNAACRLVGLRYRRERARRQPLVQELQEALSALP